MSITGRLFAGARERRGATGPWGDTQPPLPGGAGPGGPMNETAALQVVAVLACVGMLADAVATLPLYTYRRLGSVRQPVDPAPPLVDRPFAEITRQDWLSQMMVALTLRGNAYGQIIERDRLGFATQIFPLHPDQVVVRRASSGDREYRVNGKVTPTADVVHIPALSLPGSLVGINPIEEARTALNLARSAEAYGAAFFSNSANASGVIEVPGTLNSDETLAMARDWMAAHQGVNHAHLPAVLTGGASWAQISINPDDAQFLQTRQLSRAEIAMLFRIPPHMIGDVDRTTSWGTGIEQQELGFVTNTLRPWLSRIESALSDLLEPEVMVRFNLSGRLRGDTLQRYQGYTLARFGGWSNVDEIREKEDEPPLPGGLGQEFIQPLNYQALGSAPPVEPGPDSGTRDALSIMLDAIAAPKTRIVERDEHGRVLRLVESSNGHGPG